MPRLWTETVETHRQEVREAILDATGNLVQSRGLLAVTMSDIAEATGIGRATLYKYFPDVEAILVAWHERHVGGHLEHLSQLATEAGSARARLGAVLEAYAMIMHHRHEPELSALLHRGEHVRRAERRLQEFIRDLLGEGAKAGEVRRDVAPDELAKYCLHALTAAGSLSSKAAVQRLVAVTVAGLQPRR